MDRQSDALRVERDIARQNAVPGLLNTDHYDGSGNMIRADGVDCPLCKNKGFSYVLRVDDNGNCASLYKKCECMTQRIAVRLLRESGLERSIQRYTFETFRTDAEWQKRMKDGAMQYLRNGVKDGAWMYVGGQSGAGKTHLCTAVAGVILRKLELRYMLWPHEAQNIKALANSTDYDDAMRPLQEVRCLYVDDFLKPVFDRSGGEAVATAADVKLAFDILNHRYVNGLPTIISSEWFSAEIVKIDQALAGRIFEMSGDYRMDIKRDPNRNYRLRQETM